MKKLLLVLVLFLSGCATEPSTSDHLQQQITRLCGTISIITITVLDYPGVSPQVIANIDKAKPFYDAVCTKDVVVTAQSLKDLLDHGAPLLLTIIEESALANTPNAQALIASVTLAKILIPQIIATLPVVK